ncbi:4Fe-4S cluster-binding domain-containing protein [Haploplasma axanthum]|uniref:Anaerobic ribonucleoside-triphosphate reductase-activating protein n=1 Tax=Haploplasma axanthum TaxID=29552 RepID=A0A449BFT4_HAPAX|nr:4Fe-4S cluster-binding domain-containing protein [Haploplasma axanthum]VEU81301.1 Pyruvate formate-lyase 1-activating enzyme [Haploplasma axanthum]
MSSILNKDEIRLSGIIQESIVDGPGMRYVVFTQGCPKRCFMCHNEATQPLIGGYIEKLDKIVDGFSKNPLLSGITISGGEPFIQPDKVLYLVRKAKELDLNVLLYSGYYYEELIKMNNVHVNNILMEADYLVDGPFEYILKNLNLLFRGSSNQRIIDLKNSWSKKELAIIESFE